VVDPDLIERKLAELELLVGQASEYRQITVEDYRRDWKTQRIVERTLQMAIETCLDVANHIVADRGLKVPSTYAETFDVLAAADLLSPELHARMRRMVGFRNIVVHEYASIDAEQVVRILRDHRDGLTRFAGAVRACL
jgi:uncharacterized protein YutE (UPF0331/DUF86 family)